MPKLQASGAFAQALDDNARALNGAYWRVYAAGTTTQATTYSNALLTIANAWPVIGDAAGRLPDIYVAPGSYRIRVETAGGVLIAESDDNLVYGIDPTDPASAKFKTVAILRLDEEMGYSLGAVRVVKAGDIVEAGGFRYSVLASGATDQDLTTAGGVKLRQIPSSRGIDAKSFTFASAATHTADIQRAIDSLASNEGGGEVQLPAWKMTLVEPIQMRSGVSLRGAGSRNDEVVLGHVGATSLFAVHSGAAVVDFTGASDCSLSDMAIESDMTTFPKIGIIAARDSAAGAGQHRIERIRVQGRFSDACVYSIASELTVFRDCYIEMYSGAGKYVFFTAREDVLGVRPGITTSTNINLQTHNVTLINSSNDPDAATFYMDMALDMGQQTHVGLCLIPRNGSYVHMHNRGFAATLGQFTFIGCWGERRVDGNPIYGYRITSAVPFTLRGLNIPGMRLDFLAGADKHPLWVQDNVFLEQPFISFNYPEAFPYAVPVFSRNRVRGGYISVDRSNQWNNVALESGWIQVLGSPFAQAQFAIDGSGNLSLRGTLRKTGGTSHICTLPVAPTATTLFDVFSDGGFARLRWQTDGQLHLEAGTASDRLNLAGISHKIGL